MKLLRMSALSFGLACYGLAAQAAPECMPQLKEYQATYSLSLYGFSVDNVRRFEKLAENRYKVSQHSSVMFMAIDEASEFTLDNAHIQPFSYAHKRKGMSKKHNVNWKFDWPSKTAVNLENDHKLTISAGDLDLLSHQVQMRVDLLCSATPPLSLEYKVLKRDDIDPYHYDVLGEEVLTTSLGKIKTLKLQKKAPDSQRATVVWLAPEWDYVIAKLQYIESDGSDYQTQITQLQWKSESSQ